jgi:hypothetical protein
MFDNETQRSRACRALLALVRLERFWDEYGPTSDAVRQLETGLGGMSPGEAAMVRAAFDVWNGEGKCSLSSVLYTLDPRCCEAVCSLAIALHAGKVDAWLTAHETSEARPPRAVH